jgi:lipoprotein-releasing system permease protein
MPTLGPLRLSTGLFTLLKIALRYTFNMKGTLKVVVSFAVLGIALGVFSLITVNTVMNGFRSELIASLISSSGAIVVLGKGGKIENYEAATSRIKQLPEVKAIKAVTSRWVLADFNNQASCWPLKALQESSMQKNELAISNSFASTLQCKIGDKVCLTDLNMLLFGRRASKSFKVVKIEQGSDESLSCALAGASLFGANAISYLSVSVLKPENVEETSKALLKLLPANCYVRTWKDLNPQLLDALAIEKVSMLTILTLIVIVGSLNCLSTIVMLVESKKKEIAVLKTVGASTKGILTIFLLSGFFIALVATAIGSTLASLLICNAENIKVLLSKTSRLATLKYFLDRLPLGIDWSETFIIIGASVIISLLATLYPAYKAAKSEPVKVLNANG